MSREWLKRTVKAITADESGTTVESARGRASTDAEHVRKQIADVRRQSRRLYAYAIIAFALVIVLFWWRVHRALEKFGPAAWLWIVVALLLSVLWLASKALISAAWRTIRPRRAAGEPSLVHEENASGQELPTPSSAGRARRRSLVRR